MLFLITLIIAFSLYSTIFIHMGSAGIYQTSTVCLALFSMVGEYQVAVVVFAQEIVLSRSLAVLLSLLGKLQQKRAHT